MVKNLADKLSQYELKGENPYFIAFKHCGRHGRGTVLWMHMKIVCINSNFQNPIISVANHHRNNLRPILHLHYQYYSHTHANLLTYLNTFSPQQQSTGRSVVKIEVCDHRKGQCNTHDTAKKFITCWLNKHAIVTEFDVVKKSFLICHYFSIKN